MTNAKPKNRLNPEARRGLILEQAILLIGERGYHGFKIRDLAIRCGITNGTLLYYFGSKEGVLVAVLEERDRLETEIVSTFKPTGSVDMGLSLEDALELLRTIATRATARLELTRLHAILQSEALDPMHPAHDYFNKREALVLEAFTALVAPHVSDATATARELFSLLDGLVQRWLRAKQGFDFVKAWDAVAQKILAPRS